MKYILIVGTLLLATTASACSFGPGADIFKTPQENYETYEHVLSVSITEGGGDYDPQGSVYTFTVHEEHKGSVGKQEIKVRSPGHSCGFFGSVGQSFLWFTNDVSSIDEASPKKGFDSIAEVVELGESLEKDMPHITRGCTKEYQPVCGELNVQCVTAPCPPIRETYSNTCLAEQAGATVISKGACVVDPVIVIEPNDRPGPNSVPPEQLEPDTEPGIDFVSPETDPPYNNSPYANNDVIPELSWWDRMWAWITSLFSW